MDVVRSGLSGVRSYVGAVSWTPFVRLSRGIILSLFSQIEHGALELVDSSGQVWRYGGAAPQHAQQEQQEKQKEKNAVNGSRRFPTATLTVHKDTFWVRMLLFADLGFAESYMLGDFSCPELTSFFEVFIMNREKLSNATTLTSSVVSMATNLLRRTNTLANSRLNTAAHYDISNEMFSAFLSPDMTYSCPIWTAVNPESPVHETLEQAQYNKIHHIISAARIKSSDHVLEIGTGWGSLAIEAVRKTGCSVTSLTLSAEQKALAEQRIADAGLTDNIEVLLCDYRALPIPQSGRYDKVVSIEMIEAVGSEYLSTYFSCVDALLKPTGGIAVFQCITMPECRYEAYKSSTDFIREYIFPGGHLPSPTLLLNAAAEGSHARLLPQNILNIGPHYARTLREWRESFNAQWTQRIKPALLAEHRGMTPGDAELFRRKWEYYFAYCEAGFRLCAIGDVIVTFARDGALEMADDVPL